MNLNKILKGYLIFILSISAMGALSYNDSIKNYSTQLLSVVHALDEKNEKEIISTASSLQFKNDEESFLISTSPMNDIVFTFEAGEENFAQAAETGVEINKLKLKSGKNTVNLKRIKFSIEDEDSTIEQAYLMSNDGTVIKGRIGEKEINFEGIDFKVEPETAGELNVIIDIAADANSGNRLRLNIEKAEDIELEIDGKKNTVNGYYPLEGSYLSIVRTRQTEKTSL